MNKIRIIGDSNKLYYKASPEVLMKLFTILLLFSLNTLALSNSIPAEDNAWKSNVLLSIPGYDQDGSLVDGLCNGTLIDAKTIISAAHCYQRSEVLTGKKFKIEVGEYRYIIKDGVKIRVGYRHTIKHETTAQLRFLPGVNPNNSTTIPPELDIVVIKLQEAIALPTDFIFAPFWNSALPKLDANSKLTVVSVNPIETISHNDAKQMALLNRFTQGRINIESTSTSRVAQGDSGAPVFATINGKTYLIGVVKGTVQSFGSVRDIFVTLQGRLRTD